MFDIMQDEREESIPIIYFLTFLTTVSVIVGFSQIVGECDTRPIGSFFSVILI